MHALSEQLSANPEPIVRDILGEPTTRTWREMRYGRNGSLCVTTHGPKRGLWHDFESGEGGDLIALIQRERCVDFAGAAEIAKSLLGGHYDPPLQRRALKVKPRVTDDETADRVSYALVTAWSPVQRLHGTLAEHYLAEHRRLDISGVDLEHALGWHPGINAIIGLMTDPVTAEPCGVHRTFLNSDGTKRERKMLGRQGVVRLSPDEDVTSGLGICEGVEDGIAIALSGWAPIWVATSAGAIARFPVLNGVECLTIFADADDAGQAAAATCAARLRDAGCEVDVRAPGELPHE